MVILVTGGAGFIGSFVVEQLCDLGHEVRVLDRLHPGAHDGVPADLDPRAEWRWGDCCDDRGGRDAPSSGVDAVCHQAAMVGLGVDLGDAPGYVRDNDLGTAVLLAALHERDFRGPPRGRQQHGRVRRGRGTAARRTASCGPRPEPVPTSKPRRLGAEVSASVATRSSPVAVDETAPPDPRNVYAATKLHQEHLCAAYGREHDVAGHRAPLPQRLRPTDAARHAVRRRGEHLPQRARGRPRPRQVFEDGGQLRDFVHVTDVARANVAALTAADPGSGAYNVASGERHSVLEMAQAIAAGHPGRGPAPAVVPRYRLGDVRHVFGATDRARQELGFVARGAVRCRDARSSPRHRCAIRRASPAPYPVQ